MSTVAAMPTVLTLREAAELLRLPAKAVERHADLGVIPGRKIDGSWRFLHAALEDWLRAPTGREVLLQQAGAFADDDSSSELRAQIYAARGRPECEPDATRS